MQCSSLRQVVVVVAVAVAVVVVHKLVLLFCAGFFQKFQEKLSPSLNLRLPAIPQSAKGFHLF